jgi:hypothetical protein
MRTDELLQKVTDFVKLSGEGKIVWNIQCQTTEYNEPSSKPVEHDEDGDWVVDECFVSYNCTHKGEEFLMITYEQIFTCGEKQKTINLVFIPPLVIRYFDVDVLAPYAIEVDQVLLYEIHLLWLAVLEQYKSDPESIHIDANRRELILQ